MGSSRPTSAASASDLIEATPVCAAPHPSTPPSISPPPVRLNSTNAPRPSKYTPYKLDTRLTAPPEKAFTSNSVYLEDNTMATTVSDSRGAGPLLLAALESMEEADGASAGRGGSHSQDEGQSLSPHNYSNHSSERTSETSVSDSRDAGSGSVNGASNQGYHHGNSAYSHPAYSNLQHPLYSRPVAPSSAYPSSTYSLPPINRSSYTPYNYQSSYSRPLSASGPKSGNPLSASGPLHGNTTLPPLNLAVFSANADPMFRPPQNLASPIGGTNPSSYAQSPSSLNPYNHPAYASAASHTYQHPAYARASFSAASAPSHFAPPPPALPQSVPPSQTNPYNHPSLPQAGTSSNFPTPPSPWSGPPPPPLSITSGSALAKRRRSETAGSVPQATNPPYGGERHEQDHFDEQDELDEGDEGESEDTAHSKRAREETGQTGYTEDDEVGPGEDEDDADYADQDAEEAEGPADGDEDELAPQVYVSRPTKRARTTSAKSDDAPAKPSTQIRPKPGTSASRAPVIKSKGATKAKTKTEKSKEPVEKKFICPHPSCGRAFARHFNLNSHIKSHQGIREFKCPECSKLFSRKHDCTRHCIAIHHYDRDSGKGPIHEPSENPGRPSNHLSPAPNSPPTVPRPLPPAALLLHASGTSTGNHSARQSLAMLLQPPRDGTEAAESSARSAPVTQA
ncbi:hypothetical protein JCM16303_000945 [Sporobolomyces ruberrimus]